MVRLRPIDVSNSLNAFSDWFPFHYGSIETARKKYKIVLSFSQISIPLWFDWDRLPYGRLASMGIDFHSTMVRLRLILCPVPLRRASDFHSTMVRLRHGKIASVMPMPKDFHSTMVRLRPGMDNTTWRIVGNFHSTMVRLRLRKRLSHTQRKNNFHSTMVRLRLRDIIPQKTRELIFPFHNGSIETQCHGWGRYAYKPFPFHNGSIETSIEGNENLWFFGHFHSTMVRLRRFGKETAPPERARFPFHNGSIETSGKYLARKHRK